MKKTKTAGKTLRSLLGAAVITVICAPASATPTQYDIAFTGGSPAPTGSFLYDPAVPAFSDFIVTWNGLTFDLTGSANTPVFNGGTVLQLPLCGATSVNAALTFGILTGSGCSPVIDWRVDAITSSSVLFAFDWSTGQGGGNFFIASPGVAYDNTCFSTCSRGDFSVTARVPEPATLALLGIGIAGIGLSRRRGARTRSA